MLSPLSRGFGTWTGNYDPYNEEGADTDSLPEIDEPHRHGITVGFVSRTPPATAVSPPYKTQHYHGREASFSGGLHPTRENTFSGRRAGSGRDVSPLSRENSDAKMNLPKTYLTRKGALMLFSAPEDEELDSLSHTEPRPRFMRVRKQADLIDTSLKLGTLDKLAMSVLQFGDEELDKEFNRMSDQKKHLFMKFLTKVDERDVDERAQPGGDVRHYLRDLKHKTSLQMGLTGDTALPRSREALELRAILRGLQNDNWPCVYRQDTTDFRKPSALAYQFSRPPSHLDHPPRNHYQRILSSRKLEDSVQSLRSYLGRSLDSEDEGPVPLLTRRRAKYKRGSEMERTKYSQVDEDVSRRLRPHMNTPTKGEGTVNDDLSDEEEESLVEEGQCLEAKSTARDDGYFSVSQADTCSFILGPRNWTPVTSQAPVEAPVEEVVPPKVTKIDIKQMVDKGSTDFDVDSSLDEGLDGEGLVVGIAQGSDDSDVEIIYSNLDVPDNTLDTFDGFHSNNTSYQTNSNSVLLNDTNQETLVEGDSLIPDKEVKSANNSTQTLSRKSSPVIADDSINSLEKNILFDSSTCINNSNLKSDIENDIVGTTYDNENYNSDPEFIASDGEDIDGLIEAENEKKIISIAKNIAPQVDETEIIKNRAIGSASSHKRSLTPSSIHSTARDDDQSSVTILPHDQDLISVDVKSATTHLSKSSAQGLDEDSQVTDKLAPTSDSQKWARDTESNFTGDDATSVVMSMGEDSSTVVQTLRDLHGDDDEESRDKLGEIIDPRLPRDDRGRIEMIDNEELNLHFTKTSTPFPPPTPTNESLLSAKNNLSTVKDESISAEIQSREMSPDSTLKSIMSDFKMADSNVDDRATPQNYEMETEMSSNISEYESVSASFQNVSMETKQVHEKLDMDNKSADDISKQIPTLQESLDLSENMSSHKQASVKSESMIEDSAESVSRTPEAAKSVINASDNDKLSLKPDSSANLSKESNASVDISVSKVQPAKERDESGKLSLKPDSSANLSKESNASVDISVSKVQPAKERDESGSEKSIKLSDSVKLVSNNTVLVKGDNSNRTTPDIKLDDNAEIPHPTTPRSTEITTEDKVSPRPKSESSSKLGEQIEEEVVPETLVSFQEDVKPVKKKREPIVIPDSLKPKQQTKSQPRKDQKKKGQKVKKEAKTPVKDVTKAMDITSVQPDEQEDEITQIIKKKVQLPPEHEHSVIPDFVSEAIKRSAERSKQQLEIEYKEKEEMISKEIANNLYEGEEGISAEELELAKKALLEKEELTKDKLLKGKQQKRLEEKGRRSGGSSSVRSKKSKGPSKDAMQLEKERIKALKEQEKQQRLEEIKALEEKIKASNDILSADEKRFKDKLQEVQLELDRIEREAHMAEQTEADVRHALKEDRMKRLEDKAKLKKEEMNRKRLQAIERKQQEKQLKEESRQRESKKIMMLMDDEERKRRQEEQKLRLEEEEKEEEKRRKEEDEELARSEREEEERRRQLEEEIEQEQLKRLQEEQDEIRIQQEAIAAQKEALLEEQRRKRELAALEEQRQREELERKENEEMRRLEDQRARMDELTRLEEEVRDNMRRDMERRKDNAIMRREYNIDSKHNLNKIKHSQSINRAWVWSYFIPWPMESYMRPIGDQEKKKKEAKLRAKRKKAR